MFHGPWYGLYWWIFQQCLEKYIINACCCHWVKFAINNNWMPLIDYVGQIVDTFTIFLSKSAIHCWFFYCKFCFNHSIDLKNSWEVGQFITFTFSLSAEIFFSVFFVPKNVFISSSFLWDVFAGIIMDNW